MKTGLWILTFLVISAGQVWGATWITQPTDGIDTRIAENNPDYHYGSHVQLIVGLTLNDNTNKTLINFDLSSFPSDSQAAAAGTLYLYHYYANITAAEPGEYYSRLHIVKKEWNESTSGADGGGGGTGATWNAAKHGVQNWQIAGCSGANDISGAMDSTFMDTVIKKWYTWVIPKDTIQGWIDDTTTNRGMLIVGATTDTADGQKFFYSSDDAHTEKPWLVIPIEATIDTPAVVYGVDTTSVGTTSVALVWAKNESTFCTGYEVRAKAGQYFYPTDHTQGWLVGETDTITDTTITATDLLPGTWQSLTVFAKGTGGTYSDTAAGDSSSVCVKTHSWGGFNYFRHLNIVNTGANTLYNYPVKARFEAGFVDAEYNGIFGRTTMPVGIYNADTNRTYIAYISKAESVNVFFYDHSADTLTPPYIVGVVPTTAEIHGNASIVFDTLGYIHIFYGCHTSQVKHKRSSVPYEINEGWGVINTPGESVTYPNPILLEDGSIGLGVRGNGANRIKIFDWWHSTDNGSTWTQTPILLPDSSGSDLGRIYHGAWAKDDSNNIHWALMFVNTQAEPDNYCNFFYLECLADGSTWVSTAGDTYSLPIDLTEIEVAMWTDTNVVYKVSYPDINVYDGRPAIVGAVANRNDTSDGSMWFSIKHDSGWANYEVCHVDNFEDIGRLFIEDSLNMTIYIAALMGDKPYFAKHASDRTPKGGQIDIFKTTDGGKTWQKTSQLTDYPVQIVRMHRIYDYDSNVASHIKLVWGTGLIQPITLEVYPPQWEYGYYEFNYDMVGSDGEDVRFFSTDLSDTFPYFLERWEPWGKSDFWFKMDSVFPGTTKVLVGMGNPNLNSESCGDSVFDFYEDFADTAGWKEIYGTTNIETVTFIDGRQVPAFSVKGTLNLIRKALPYDSMTISVWMFVNYRGDEDQWATCINHNGLDTIAWHYIYSYRWGAGSWVYIASDFRGEPLGLTPPYTNTCGWIPWEYNSKTGVLNFQYDSAYAFATGIETDSISIGDYTPADSNTEAYATYVTGRRAVSTEPTTYWGDGIQFYEFWDRKTEDFAFGDTSQVEIEDDQVRMATVDNQGVFRSKVYHIYAETGYGFKTWALKRTELDIAGFVDYYVRASDNAFSKTAESPAWTLVTPGVEISPNLSGAYIQYKIEANNFKTSDQATAMQMGRGKIVWSGEESRVELCPYRPGVDDVGMMIRKYRK